MKSPQRSSQSQNPILDAIRELKRMRQELENANQQRTEPIAIVGMGCRFPGGSDTPEAYWDLLINGIDAVSEVPKERWDIDAFYDPDMDAKGKMYTRCGAFLETVDQFDPQFFGIAPREAIGMDPQQRLLLEVAWEALENAGQAPDQLMGSNTGVFIGLFRDDYFSLGVGSGDPEKIDTYNSLGNGRSMAAGRVSYVLGLNGPTLQVDTACSSSLVSVHLACQSLRDQACNMALAGGVNLMLDPSTTISTCAIKALSPVGRCKTFDSSADGYGRGEGCGLIILKRLSDALANGDNILATIKGSAINHDGHSNGLTAPSGVAQETLIRQALGNSQVVPEDISYVEVHGTGTALGDPIEASALINVFCRNRSESALPLTIGSAKTNVGHLEGAAGIAALIKVVLSLQHKTIPPHLHFKTPSPYISWDKFPIRVPTESQEWLSNHQQRLAGVSAFGLSGTNAHLIVGEAPEPIDPCSERSSTERPWSCLSLSAKNQAALKQLAERYRDFIVATPETALKDICFTANTGRSHLEHRLVTWGKNRAEIQQQLTTLVNGDIPSQTSSSIVSKLSKAKVAFRFSSTAITDINLVQELYITQSSFRATIDRCNEQLNLQGLQSLAERLISKPNSSHAILDDPIALFILEYALAKLFIDWGVQPSLVIAEGLIGKYVAACIAKVLDLEDALTGIIQGSQLVKNSLLEKRAALFRAVAEQMTYRPETLPLFAYRTPQHLEQVDYQVISQAEYWVEHFDLPPLASAQRLQVEIQQLESQNCSFLLEFGLQLLGEGAIATEQSEHTFTNEIVRLPILQLGHSNWSAMLKSLGQLYVAGFEINWPVLEKSHSQVFQGRLLSTLPNYPFQRQRYWMENVSKHLRLQDKSVAFSTIKLSNLHPLLHRKIELPGLKEIRFETILSTNTLTYLNDHQIFQTVIFPGSGYFEMALCAGKQVFRDRPIFIESVTIERAMSLPFDQPKTMQMVLRPEDKNCYRFQLLSQDSEGEWLPHLHGLIRQGSHQESELDIGESFKDPETFIMPTMEPVNLKNHYQSFVAQGIHYGPHFQGLKGLWRQDKKVVAQINLPQPLVAEMQDYSLHPVLLDACFQGLRAALPASSNGKTYLPIALEQLKVYSSGHQTLWCRGQLRSLQNGVRPLIGDLDLYSETGEIVAQVRGLAVQQANPETLLPTDTQPMQDWFYKVTWEQQSLPSLPTSHSPSKRWLIFADQCYGELLKDQLVQRGDRCTLIFYGDQYQALGKDRYVINLAEKKQFSQVLEESWETGYDSILHLWSLDAKAIDSNELSPPMLQVAQELSCGSTLHLLQALEQHMLHQKLTQQPQLWWITASAQAIESVSTKIQLPQASLSGFLRSLRIERSDLDCRHIDLDSSENNLDNLLQELVIAPSSEAREEIIAWRGQHRYVARLTPWHLPKKASHTPIKISSEATYLITGGTGALGLKMASWLAQQGARHVALLSRRKVPEVSAHLTISNLEKTGVTVYLLQADVAKADELTAAFSQLKSMPPLKGMIHTAGVLRDGQLTQQKWANFETVMAPKVTGAWNLHQITQKLSLDFFVCFSSAASMFGSAGQGNYAAANAFMDGLAAHRRTLGLHGLSINWGPWSEVGMAKQLGEHGQLQLQRLGIDSISPPQGLQAFEALLEQPIAQVAVVSLSWDKFLSQFNDLAPVLFQQFANHAGKEEQLIPSVLQELMTLPSTQRRNHLFEFVRTIVSKISGLDLTQPDMLERGFFDLGMDSLMSVELQNSLREQLGCQLNSTVVFKYSTVPALVDYLIQDVLALNVNIDVSKTGQSLTTPDSNESMAIAEHLPLDRAGEDWNAEQSDILTLDSDPLENLSQDEIATLLAQELNLN